MHFSIVLFNPGSVTVTASEVELRHGLAHLSSPVVVFQHLVQVLFCSESLSVKISYGCQRFRSILIRGEFVIMKRFVVILFHTVAQLIHFTQFILRGSHAQIRRFLKKRNGRLIILGFHGGPGLFDQGSGLGRSLRKSGTGRQDQTEYEQ